MAALPKTAGRKSQKLFSYVTTVLDTPKIYVVAQKLNSPKWPPAEDPIHFLVPER